MRSRFFVILLFVALSVHAQYTKYVAPLIGSEGEGRVFVGPSMPFGLVKPGPDCVSMPNSGWAKMPEAVKGFSQTHVSGTGGGQKYGNILIQPFAGNAFMTEYLQHRSDETVSLGYYSCDYQEGPHTEITTSERCALYRFKGLDGLLVDVHSFLGIDTIPDKRETQQFVDCQIQINGKNEITGYSTVRGGWNNGGPYTVYFCLQSDAPFKNDSTKDNRYAWVTFDRPAVNVKVGISFVSVDKARDNIVKRDFDEQLLYLRDTWEVLLSKIKIKATDSQLRMFYTALYHTMLMPVDRSVENPSWTDTPYYDDYYAIWDIYRTSLPLITLLDPARERDIVNSLLNIYKNDGYMPDARSGNCNGRTQGGSNAEIVIADAFAKGLSGIDYELALKAMIQDAEVAPADAEKEGRGGIAEYNSLGYIPYGIDRAGNRTVEYSYDDWCIAQVAKGLGHQELYDKYSRRSGNWRNLWRQNYSWHGMHGFIMPRDANGKWLDSVPWGKSKVYHPLILYKPDTKVAPWYVPWWGTFFYEALSAEYSLSIPHDVPGLIDACGGAAAFRERLDLFFDKGYYNVANEPSFLSPCLYHWLGRPDLSGDRVRQIVNRSYADRPDGLPGNDDSGAMSSWFAFHCLGIYPNAGQSYYLLHVPLVSEYTFRLSNGNVLYARIVGKGTHFVDVTFNGKLLPDARIEHAEMMKGGELIFHVDTRKSDVQHAEYVPARVSMKEMLVDETKPFARHDFTFVLNRQYRMWHVSYAWDGDTLHVICNHTCYLIPRDVVDNGDAFCWSIPVDGMTYHQVNGTFDFISKRAMNELREKGRFTYDGIIWRMVDGADNRLHVRADIDRTEMWITVDGDLPMVVEMRNNPLGIDWTAK